ncbi:MAG: fused MFS/spermidine synthase [Candidatus Diapherotrites archaeon]
MGFLDKYYLFITVFFTGAAVLMLEILGTRILAPFFGTTVFVWSSLISVAIIALAIGYFAGGKIADSRPEWKIMYLFIFVAAILIIISVKIDVLVLLATESAGMQFGPLLSSLILFGPALFLLGAVTPFAVKLKADALDDIGATAGNLYAVGTLGSFFGAITTGFFLIPIMGIESIAILFAGFLFIICGIWFLKKGNFATKSMLVVFLILILVPRFGVALPEGTEIVYKTESAYSQLKVVDITEKEGTARILMSYGSMQTVIEKNSGKSLTPYTYKMIASLSMNPDAKKALVIGNGGGTISMELARQGLETDAIELDPVVLDIAEEYFGFKESEKLHLFLGDGRKFLADSNEKYDLILMDVYSSYSPPSHMFTTEMFQSVKDSLSEEGVFVVNSVGWVEGEKAILQHSIYKTLKTVFPNVYVSYENSESVNNVIFFASQNNFNSDEINLKKLIPDEKAVVFTDDFNPIDQYSAGIIEEWRNANIENFGAETLLG